MTARAARTIAIVGTDTEVGKTCAVFVIAEYFRRAGATVAAVKPYSSGEAFGVPDRTLLDPNDCAPTPARYELPLSPWGAVRRGEPLVPRPVVEEYLDRAVRSADMTVIEGIGGVMTPLEENLLWLDLHAARQWPAIVVGRSGLGTINHTLLTVAALRSRRILVLGFILNAATCAVDPRAAEENSAIIHSLTSAPALGTVSYAADDWRAAWRAGIDWTAMEAIRGEC